MLKNFVRTASRSDWVWILQEAQNCGAFFHDVPCRLANRNCAIEVVKKIERDRGDEYLFKLLDDPLKGMSEVCEDLTRWNEELSSVVQNFWITEGVYSNPLLTMFREFDPWRVWEQIWAINTTFTTQARKDSDPKIVFFGGTEFGRSFMCAAKAISGTDLVLLVGPVWRFQSSTIGAPVSGARVTQKIVHDFIDTRKRLYPREDPERVDVFLNRMLRWGGERAAISSADLYIRAQKIGSMIEQFLLVDLYSRKDLAASIRESEFNSNLWGGVAQLSLLLQENDSPLFHDKIFQFQFRSPTINREDEGSESDTYYLTATKEGRASKNGDSQNGWRIRVLDTHKFPTDIESDSVELTGRISGVQHSTPTTRSNSSFSRIIDAILGGDSSKPPPLKGQLTQNSKLDPGVVGLDTLLSRLVDKIQGTREAYILERQALVRYRLEDEWSKVPRLVRQTKGRPRISQNGIELRAAEKALETICYTLNATACFVYRYDYPEQSLRGVGHYVRDQTIESFWPRRVMNLMQEIGDDNVLRSKSICYKAFDAASRLVWFNAVNQLVMPKKCPIIVGGAIATPIRIYGRVWGILEVIYDGPNRIRNSMVRYADEYARLIGGYLFQHWLQRELLLLAHTVHLALTDEVTGEQIAGTEALKSLSRIFMVEQVSVWRPNDDGLLRTFSLKWFHGHKISGRRAFREDETSVGSALIRADDLWFSGNMKDRVNDRAWNNDFAGDYIKCRRADPEAHGYGVAKLVSSDGSVSGIVWLIGRQDQGFDWRWGNFLAFFSEYYELIFTMIEHRNLVAASEDVIRRHEILGQIRAFRNGMDGLSSAIKGISNQDLIVRHGANTFAALRDFLKNNNATFRSLGAHSDEVLRSLEAFVQKAPRTRQNFFYDPETSPWLLNYSFERLEELFDEFERRVRMLDPNERHNYAADRERVDFLNVVRQSRVTIPERKSVIYSGETSSYRIKLPFYDLITIVRNLIENAVKYNCVETAPTAQSLIKENKSWRFVVRNKGFLIPKEEFEEIAESGKRAKFASRMDSDGEGWGLWIVKSHLERWDLQLFRRMTPVDIPVMLLNTHARALSEEFTEFAEYEFEFVIPWSRVEKLPTPHNRGD